MSAHEDQGDDRGTPGADLRLPGSVAEIMASPPGPKIGAFFDLDGTLVAGFTAVILTQERLLRRDMGVGELLSMVQAGLSHTLGRIEFEDLIGKAAARAGRPLVRRPGGDRRAAVRRSGSSRGSTRRCASWSGRTWLAGTPWCSVRRR